MSLTSFVKQRLKDVEKNAAAVGHAGATVARDVGGAVAAGNRALTTAGTGVQRSLVGAAQGASGVVDLATPGTGTSRVSHLLQSKAVNLDQQAKKLPFQGLYKPGQVIGDAAQFAIPGGAIEKGLSLIPKGEHVLAGATHVVKPVTAGIDHLAQPLEQLHAPGRIAAATVRATLAPKNAVNAAGATLQQEGSQASKGRDVSARSTAESFAGNIGFGGAIHGTGKAAQEAVPLIKGAARDAKEFAMGTPRPHKNISDAEVQAAQRVSQSRNGFGDTVAQVRPDDVKVYRQVQQKLGVEPNNHDAVDQMLGQFRTYNSRKAALQGGYVKVPGSKKGATPDVPHDSNGNPLLARSTPEDMPVSLKDALVAKQAKLEKLKVSGDSPTPTKAPSEPLPTSDMPVPGDAPSVNAGRVKQTRFTSKTVQNSDQVAPEVKAQTDASYTSDTMKGAAERAQQHIMEHGAAPSLEQTLSELNTTRGTASRDTIARAIEHAKALDATGTEQGQAMAAKLYDLAGEHGSAHGQSSQILAAIAAKSPAGLRNKAFRDLKANGIDVNEDHSKDIAKLTDKLNKQTPGTPEHKATQKEIADLTKKAAKNKAVRDEVQGHINSISKMNDGPEKDFAVAVMQKAVAKHLPQKASDQAISLWKAGLLSGNRTHSGNIVSNTTFGVLKKASDIPAAAADQALSLVTGKRTKTSTLRGLPSGTKEGFSHAKTTLKTGIDERNIGDKYEQHAELNTNNKLLKPVFTAANGVFRALGAEDQPTYYASLKNSLYDQAKADGLNKGLRGQALRDHMMATVKNPTEQMVETAKKEADKSVLGYDTFASKAVQGIHKGIDNLPGGSEAGKTAAHAVVNVLAPFVRVPSAFISRTIDFTPAGPFKEAVSQVAHGKFDQRALSQAIGEGMTGTGVIALGMALSQHNLISGDYPKNDPKEATRWKVNQIQPNSVKLGGRWVSMNYLGPLGLLFNAGHKIETAKGESDATKAGQAVAGLGQGLLGQSFLQGFSGLSDAINNPEQSAKSYINSQVSSLVPGAVNDVANATDKYQRQANSVPQAIESRIPIAREKNVPIKTDVYGNKLEQNNQGLGVLNPTRPSTDLGNKNPVIAEVNRLHTVNPQDSTLQVTPSPVGRTITIDKKNVTLSDSQRAALQTAVGQATQSKWNELIKTPEYKAMDDNQKAAALNNIKSLATEDATRAYVVGNNLGSYSKSESPKAVALSEGTNSIADLASSKATGGLTTTIAPKLDSITKKFLTTYNATSAADKVKAANSQSDYEYKVAQAQYDNNKALGKLTTAQDIKAQDALAKAKVGATYDKNVRDLYGLSSDELTNYLTRTESGVDKVGLEKKIVAYGDALVDAGVISKNKFRTTKGAVSIGKTSTRKSRSGTTFKTVSLASIKSNPYKSSRKTYHVSALPKFTKGRQVGYKTAKLTTNIDAKLKKA